jgi:hypothetical protein
MEDFNFFDLKYIEKLKNQYQMGLLRYTKILAEESKLKHQNDDHIFNMKDAEIGGFSTIQILAYHIKGVLSSKNPMFDHYKN